MKNVFTILLYLLLYATPELCLADHIILDINPSSYFRNGKIILKADITNKGNEPAVSLKVKAKIANISSESNEKEILEVGDTFHTEIELGNAPAPAGIYTIAISVHYNDANGYPFTAISSIPLITAHPNINKNLLIAELQRSEIVKDDNITLKIKSLSDKDIKVLITLILPDELKSYTNSINLSIPQKKEITSTFKVSNISALPGSIYSILAIVDYQWKDQHQSFITSGSIRIKQISFFSPDSKSGWLISIFIFFLLFIILQFKTIRKTHFFLSIFRFLDYPLFRKGFICLIFIILLGFILYNLSLSYVFMDTLTTGGDMPAHNYLASHLKEKLFEHGRIVSWAEGWWCGFPIFQFYFCLPYLIISLLDFILPFNIAFKLVTILGIIALPFSAYASTRIMKVSKPVPIIMAIAMLPFLFIKTNTIWGASIYSTLAGMISNSISFPIMLMFIASTYRDSNDGNFRIHSVFLLVALLASHFFTSVIALLTIIIFPVLHPKAGFIKSLSVLIKECGLAFLLMAWWFIPLVAKKSYSVDFGENWDIILFKTLPPPLLWILIITTFISIIIGVKQKIKFVAVSSWMLGISTILFYFGYNLSHVFVNVRLWPFIFYSLLALAACGTGSIIRNFKASEILVCIFLMVGLSYSINSSNNVLLWSKWNYEGVENKPYWSVFEDLILPLDKTPGRLANDLHDKNNALGSSRIFECVPHIIEKPILEGGIVNSALGSMFSYYIQSETSKKCAGFPKIVTPTTFNFTNATKHLELFNVKHFIARWSETKKALSESNKWKLLRKSHGWELYELLTHNGNYVFIPPNYPLVVKTDHWKQAGLNWMYTIQNIDQPFIIIKNKEFFEKDYIKTILNEKKFNHYLLSNNRKNINLSHPINVSQYKIWDEEVSNNGIKFKTNGIGLPHIIKYSYFPNWKVKGAKKIYMVTPCFMLVFPNQEEVELCYGYTFSDNIGRSLSVFGIIVLIIYLCQKKYFMRNRLITQDCAIGKNA